MTLRCTLVWLLLAAASQAAEAPRISIRFTTPEAAQAWRTVNDGVMGGRSDGRALVNKDKHLEFFGTLSLQNNGGFASVRASFGTLGIKPGDSIYARVRGDGREYNFNLYTQQNLGGYSYRQSFRTRKGEWIEVKLPLDRFSATWRGRVFRNERLDPARVAGLGILLGDKKPGPFKLEVESIWIGPSAPVDKRK